MNDDFSGPTGTGVWPGKIERMRVTLQKAKSWGRPCRPGDKFPWEALGTADLKVVYRKQSAIKLWETSGQRTGVFIFCHHQKRTSRTAKLLSSMDTADSHCDFSSSG